MRKNEVKLINISLKYKTDKPTLMQRNIFAKLRT